MYMYVCIYATQNIRGVFYCLLVAEDEITKQIDNKVIPMRKNYYACRSLQAFVW